MMRSEEIKVRRRKRKKERMMEAKLGVGGNLPRFFIAV
jgi:hypothetical protein